MRPTPYSFKVVLLGEGRVGKTSIALRYAEGQFSDKQVPTVQASFLSKRLTVDGQPCQLAIWDTAGQERFHALGPIYYRDANAALLVYDVTDSETFERVKRWVKELQKMAPPGIHLTIAANKVDLDKNELIDLGEAKRYAQSIGASFFATSAKLNSGVEDAFVSIAQRLVEQRRGSATESLPAVTSRKSVVVVDHIVPIVTEKSKCCY